MRKAYSTTKSAVSGRKFKDRHPGYNVERVREWRERNPEKVEARRALDKDRRQQDPRSQLVKAASSRAYEKGLPFNITIDDLVIPEYCPVLGIPITRIGGKRSNNSPSLDRIIPELGYVKGNVLVVSWRANDLKKDATVDELRKLAIFYGGMDVLKG